MEDELEDLIQWFGFTEKEIEVYLTILKNGSVPIHDIVEQTDVSRRHVYNIIETLGEADFIIVNDYITPTIVEPADPEDIYQLIQSKADELVNALKAEYRKEREMITDIEVIKSRSTVVTRIREIIQETNKRIALSVPMSLLPSLEDELREAVEDNVIVLLLVYRTADDRNPIPDIEMDGLASVIRYREDEVPILVAADREFALTAHRGAISQHSEGASAIYSVQGYIESVIFTSLMDSEWRFGEEMYVASPPSLPKTYSNFRQAVFDAKAYKQSAGDLWAKMKARPTQNPETDVEIAGYVTQVKQRFIEPMASERPHQCALVLQTPDGRVSFGASDAHLEDYQTYSLSLRDQPISDEELSTPSPLSPELTN